MFYFCLCIRSSSSIFLDKLWVKTELLPLTYFAVEFSSKVEKKYYYYYYNRSKAISNKSKLQSSLGEGVYI